MVLDFARWSANRSRLVQRFCKEVMMWKTLRHPNVLPLIGVTMTEFRLVMVSEWMENGNVTDFLKTNGEADRLELVSSSLSLSLPPITYNRTIVAASRRHQGLDLHARAGCDPRRPQGGKHVSRLRGHWPACDLPSIRQIS